MAGGQAILPEDRVQGARQRRRQPMAGTPRSARRRAEGARPAARKETESAVGRKASFAFRAADRPSKGQEAVHFCPPT